MLRTTAVTTALLIALPVATAAEKTEERVLLPQVVFVNVSAAGEVTKAQAANEVPEAMRPVLEAAVKGWRFTPHREQGQPVAWATQLHLGLTAVAEEGEDYRLRLRYVFTSNFNLYRTAPLPYPKEMLRQGRSAAICAEVRIGSDGAVQVLGTYLPDGQPTAKGDVFARTVRDQAKNWTAKPLRIDGIDYPAETVRRVPATFIAGKPYSPPSKPPPPPSIHIDCEPGSTTTSESLQLLGNPVGQWL